jgi:hypothetical protein
LTAHVKEPVSQEKAAKSMNVSSRTVDDAKEVLKEGGASQNISLYFPP